MRETEVTGHDTTHVDGNQVNEVIGALKTIIGEKALIAALDNLLLGSKKQVRLESGEDMTLETQADWRSQAVGVSKLIGSTVWVGSESVSVVRVLLELIQLVKNMNDTLSGHTHDPDGTPVEKLELADYKSSAEGLEQNLEAITE